MSSWQEGFWVDSRILTHLVDGETLPGEGFPPISSSHLPGGAGQRKWPAAMLPEGSPRFCLWPGQTYPCHHLYHPSGLRPAVPTRWLLDPGWLHSRRQEGEMVVRIGDGIEVGKRGTAQGGEPLTPICIEATRGLDCSTGEQLWPLSR